MPRRFLVPRRFLLIGSAQLEMRYRTVPLPCPCTTSLPLFWEFLGASLCPVRSSNNQQQSFLVFQFEIFKHNSLSTIYFCDFNSDCRERMASISTGEGQTLMIAEKEWHASAQVRWGSKGTASASASSTSLISSIYLVIHSSRPWLSSSPAYYIVLPKLHAVSARLKITL